MNVPLLAALAQARRRDNSMFAKWCELSGIASCPAAPASIAQFVADCGSLGIERLWPVVQEISSTHVSFGLADPTLGGAAAAAIDAVAGIDPPRAWPSEYKYRFKSLPYDLQVYVAAHEARREKEIRRAQNEAAVARHKLAAVGQTVQQVDRLEDRDQEKSEAATHGASASAHVGLT